MTPRPARRALVAALLLAAASAGADGAANRAHTHQMGAHMHEGPHMRFTEARLASAEDRAHAQRIVAELREAIAPFADADRAKAAGYEPFLPNVPQAIYHFVHRERTRDEYEQGKPFVPAKPGSLLYRPKGKGWELVGAMYSASPMLTQEDLDEIVPLGVARWHAHVNVCLPKGVTLHDLAQNRIGDPEAWAGNRFGFDGEIADRAACKAADGTFYPQAWGWMVHVYPFAGDDLAVAFGMDAP